MSARVTILFGERVYVEDEGYVHMPTVAQISARENCELLTVMLAPAALLMDAQAQGISLDMRDVHFETCLN